MIFKIMHCTKETISSDIERIFGYLIKSNYERPIAPPEKLLAQWDARMLHVMVMEDEGEIQAMRIVSLLPCPLEFNKIHKLDIFCHAMDSSKLDKFVAKTETVLEVYGK